jgi:hypothetical protein
MQLIETCVGLLVANVHEIDEVQLAVSKLLEHTLERLPEASEERKHKSRLFVTALIKGGLFHVAIDGALTIFVSLCQSQGWNIPQAVLRLSMRFAAFSTCLFNSP